jgi:hypothetical protein
LAINARPKCLANPVTIKSFFIKVPKRSTLARTLSSSLKPAITVLL